jgi:hypothetical protein
MAPSSLNINTIDNHKITLQPVLYLVADGTGYKKCYLSNVLKFIDNEKKIYIQSNQIYDWLENNKWKSDCK